MIHSALPIYLSNRERRSLDALIRGRRTLFPFFETSARSKPRFHQVFLELLQTASPRGANAALRHAEPLDHLGVASRRFAQVEEGEQITAPIAQPCERFPNELLLLKRKNLLVGPRR
jgi:hypothetical protein